MTKTTYKVGDKVRILDVENIIGGETHWDNGDIVRVTKAEGRIWLERKKTKPSPQKPFLHDNELQYIEKVESKPTKNQRISELEQKVEAMQAEIDALKAAQKAPVTTIADAIKRYNERTPNEQRKAIIDEAKAFIEEQFRHGYKQKYVYGPAGHDKVEFIVNAKKRTVVAILHMAYVTGIDTKAIAKCAPDDVFNADIGKAIALGRALGLDVERFEKAVQPGEVVVGMIVNRFNIYGDDLGPTKVRTVRKLGERDYKTYKTNTHEINEAYGYGEEHGDKITDDSEAQY